MNDQHGKGYLYALIAAMSTALMATFVKLAANVSVPTLIFFRNVISLTLILPTVFQGRVVLKTEKPKLHVFRALMGITGIYCYFYAVKHLELTEAIVLLNTVPLFIPIVARIWLKNPFTSYKIFAVLLGFLGVLAIIQPGYGIFRSGASLVGLLGGMITAVAFVSVKQLTKTEGTTRILFYYFIYCIVLSFFPMTFSSSPKLLWVDWMYIFFVGFFAVLYQVFMTKSYSCMAATKVGALLYLAVIFGALLDYLVWGHNLYLYEIVGGILIVLGGLLALLDRHPPLNLDKKPPS